MTFFWLTFCFASYGAGEGFELCFSRCRPPPTYHHSSSFVDVTKEPLLMMIAHARYAHPALDPAYPFTPYKEQHEWMMSSCVPVKEFEFSKCLIQNSQPCYYFADWRCSNAFATLGYGGTGTLPITYVQLFRPGRWLCIDVRYIQSSFLQ